MAKSSDMEILQFYVDEIMMLTQLQSNYDLPVFPLRLLEGLVILRELKLLIHINFSMQLFIRANLIMKI